MESKKEKGETKSQIKEEKDVRERQVNLPNLQMFL